MKMLHITAAGMLCATAPSVAGTLIVGGGNPLARACHQAAESARRDAKAVDDCDLALDQEAMSKRDRMATFVNRGLLNMYAHRYDAAMRDYDAALALVPDQPDALINKAMLTARGGDRIDEALAMLDTAIERGPDRPWVAYYSRGLVNEIGRRDAQAFADYQRAATLRPEWNAPREALSRFSTRRTTRANG